MSREALPAYSGQLACLMPEFIPKNLSFVGTNLQGIEGMRISDLPQKFFEKYLLMYAGLDGGVFARMDQFHFTENEGKTTILDKDNKSANLSDFLKVEFQKNNKVGLRFYPGGNRFDPLSPFAFVGNFDNSLLVWDENKTNIIGILDSNDRKHYLFQPGDIIDCFPQPRSIKTKMHIAKVESPVDLALGGGFVMQLKDIDLPTKQLKFDFHCVLDDRNPRDMYLKSDPTTGEPIYTYATEITVHIAQNGDQFLQIKDIPDLETSIKQGSLPDYIQNVVGCFVNSNGDTLFKLYSNLLALYPETNVHAVKGFFTTQKNENTNRPELTCAAFDVESAEQADQWLSKKGKKPSIVALPNATQERIDQFFQEYQGLITFATPKQTILATQLFLHGIIKSYYPALPWSTVIELLETRKNDIDLTLSTLKAKLPRNIIKNLSILLKEANPEIMPEAQLGRFIKNLDISQDRITSETPNELKIIKITNDIKLIYVNVAGVPLSLITYKNKLIPPQLLTKLFDGLNNKQIEEESDKLKSKYLDLNAIYRCLLKQPGLFKSAPVPVMLTNTRIGD